MFTGNGNAGKAAKSVSCRCRWYFISGKKMAYGTVAAYGPRTPFKIKLPATRKVEFDPDRWVLSEKTSINK